MSASKWQCRPFRHFFVFFGGIRFDMCVRLCDVRFQNFLFFAHVIAGDSKRKRKSLLNKSTKQRGRQDFQKKKARKAGQKRHVYNGTNTSFRATTLNLREQSVAVDKVRCA